MLLTDGNHVCAPLDVVSWIALSAPRMYKVGLRLRVIVISVILLSQ
jgi:hypothetical protein